MYPIGKYWTCAVRQRELARIRAKKRYDANPQKQIARVQAWRDANPRKAKVGAIRASKPRLFLTEKEYDDLLDACGHKCSICGSVADGRKRGWNSLCIDHNHITKEVRGLLCRKCNTGIGMFSDDIGLLERAIMYLARDGE